MTPNWYDQGFAHLWLPYMQMKTALAPLPAVATEGARIRLADGRELIDGTASWWTACHGYNHRHIRECVTRQLAQMPHVMFGGLIHEQAAQLARRLCALLPSAFERVFLSDSGSVAVEVAMKMAVQFWLNRGVNDRTKFISFKGGYHGDTTGAMSICDPEEGMHAMFTGILPRQHVVNLPRDEETTGAFESLLESHAGEIAGIIIEPMVQGAGGMIFHDATVLRRLHDAAERYELLLIFDEIFTGFGRTGRMFACEEAGVTPDIICLSKALTGGTLPLAATVTTKRIFDAFWSDDPMHALMHGPTYMANALACAAAGASFDLFEREPRLEQVAAISAQLTRELEPLREVNGIVDVRVKGAIGVVELERVVDMKALKRAFVDNGVWVRPFRNIVYLTPAFVIGEVDLARLTGSIVKILRNGGHF